jgi:phosphate transport system protein
MQDKHLSSQFDEDLNSLCAKLLQMGGLVEQQIEIAMRAFSQMNLDLCNQVIESEKTVNSLEVEIDSACVELIARRQPTARDLRLVMAISKAITNLERAGDEAERVAKRTRRIINEAGNFKINAAEIKLSGQMAIDLLRQSLDCFARLDAVAAANPKPATETKPRGRGRPRTVNVAPAETPRTTTSTPSRPAPRASSRLFDSSDIPADILAEMENDPVFRARAASRTSQSARTPGRNLPGASRRTTLPAGAKVTNLLDQLQTARAVAGAPKTSKDFEDLLVAPRSTAPRSTTSARVPGFASPAAQRKMFGEVSLDPEQIAIMRPSTTDTDIVFVDGKPYQGFNNLDRYDDFAPVLSPRADIKAEPLIGYKPSKSQRTSGKARTPVSVADQNKLLGNLMDNPIGGRNTQQFVASLSPDNRVLASMLNIGGAKSPRTSVRARTPMSVADQKFLGNLMDNPIGGRTARQFVQSSSAPDRALASMLNIGSAWKPADRKGASRVADFYTGKKKPTRTTSAASVPSVVSRVADLFTGGKKPAIRTTPTVSVPSVASVTTPKPVSVPETKITTPKNGNVSYPDFSGKSSTPSVNASAANDLDRYTPKKSELYSMREVLDTARGMKIPGVRLKAGMRTLEMLPHTIPGKVVTRINSLPRWAKIGLALGAAYGATKAADKVAGALPKAEKRLAPLKKSMTRVSVAQNSGVKHMSPKYTNQNNSKLQNKYQ